MRNSGIRILGMIGGQQARVIITARFLPLKKNVAARGLTVPIERGPDNRAFIG